MSVPSGSETVDIFSRNLGRGKACDVCRRRKLRCDGVQPVCGRCMEARNRRLARMRQKGVDEERIRQVIFPPCFGTEGLTEQSFGDIDPAFDDGASPPAKQRRTDGKAKEGGDTNDDLYFAEILSSHLPLNDVASSSKSNGDSQPSPYTSTDHPSTSNSSTSTGFPHLQGNAPIDLPSSAQIVKLTKVFLDAYRMYTTFQPQRLLERLAKGPDHEEYPHKAAIHIILALAYAERPEFDETLPEGPADGRKGLHYRHTVAAQHAIFEALHVRVSTRGFFDLTRAMLLLCYKQYAFGDVWEAYMSNATAMRGCIGLNLNKETPNAAIVEKQKLNQTQLPRISDGSYFQLKPRDAIEEEEVRRTMVSAFASDRTCCATTLWPASLSDEDFTNSMPRTTLREFITGSFSEEVMNRRARHLKGKDYFTTPSMDASQLIFKGSILLGKCAELIFRLPRDATKDYITSLPAFQKLENYITALQLNNSSFAASLVGTTSLSNSMAAFTRWLTMDHQDHRSSHYYNSLLISSMCMPYACTLTLHEPFANLSEESEAACRGASRSIITIIRLCLANAETELMQLQHMLPYIHGHVGRSLIRQLESLYSRLITQEFKQDSSWNSESFTESVSLLQADLEVVLLSLKRIGHKWPIAMRQHDTLLKFLQFNPEHRLRSLFCVEYMQP